VLKSSQEASKRLKNSAFTEIVTGFERCAAPEEKLYSNLAREQKSLATPALEVQCYTEVYSSFVCIYINPVI